MKKAISLQDIRDSIYFMRGHKVMLDRDLSHLYQVRVKALIQAVKRNKDRFPKDFMFQLEWDEAKSLRSQIVTLKQGQHLKYRPHAFTEQGIAMLSSVLKSKQAIRVNIVIMRTFVKLRKFLASHRQLAVKLSELEHKFEKHDEEIQSIFHAIRQLMTPPEKSKRQIGFHPEKD